ncbi:hypothetical protein RERY_63970 [Rhodococcus erythropolis]|nr:hypothetical protein RERY_63970 [Rhodococcus erythropolis]
MTVGHDDSVDVGYFDLDMSQDEISDRDGVETSLVEQDCPSFTW